jgi:hypothetical protein
MRVSVNIGRGSNHHGGDVEVLRPISTVISTEDRSEMLSNVEKKDFSV